MTKTLIFPLILLFMAIILAGWLTLWNQALEFRALLATATAPPAPDPDEPERIRREFMGNAFQAELMITRIYVWLGTRLYGDDYATMEAWYKQARPPAMEWETAE